MPASSIMHRVAKLETSIGVHDLDRWVKSLSDKEIEEELDKLAGKIVEYLEGHGVACAGMSAAEVFDAARQYETEHPGGTATGEINQQKSTSDRATR